MRKKRYLRSAAIGFGFGVFSVAALKLRKKARRNPETENSESEHAHPADNQQETAAHPGSQLANPDAETQNAARTDERTNAQAKRRNINWLAVQTVSTIALTLATIFVLIYHGWILREQQESMKESLKVSEQNNEVTKRAMIISSRPYVSVVQPRIVTFERGKPIIIEAMFRNEGNTPAVEVVINRIGVNFGEDLHAMLFVMEHLTLRVPEILPHSEVRMRWSVENNLSEERFRDYKAGKLLFTIRVDGEYSGLGERYPFAFCGLSRRGLLELIDCQGYYKAE